MIISSYCSLWRMNYLYSSSRAGAGQTPLHWRSLQLFSQLQPVSFLCLRKHALSHLLLPNSCPSSASEKYPHVTWHGSLSDNPAGYRAPHLPAPSPPCCLFALILLRISLSALPSPFAVPGKDSAFTAHFVLSQRYFCKYGNMLCFKLMSMGSCDWVCKKCVEKKDWSFQDSFSAAQNESSTHKNYENFRNGTLTYLWRTSAWQWYKSCL